MAKVGESAATCRSDAQDSGDLRSCEGKVVALVEWNSAGHHQTYFRYFSAALLAEGATVVPLCPWDGEEIGSLVRVCVGEGGEGALRRFEEPISCNWPPSGGGRLARYRRFLDHHRQFFAISGKLRKWERDRRRKIDLVFFCCIYDPQFEAFPAAARFLRWPWSGLYLDSRFVRIPGSLRPYSRTTPRPDKIILGRGFHSLAILDEGIIDETRAFTRGRPVVRFPDIADCRTADQDGRSETIGDKIRRFADGRKVIGCLGHLQKTKGLVELVRAAKDPRLQNVFFVFVGEANLFGIDAADRAEITDAWEHRTNFFCHPLKVSEPTYNSAFKACDMIAAVYSDFPNSSNTLTKAAAFRKPVVVSAGHLMEQRVRDFGLGLVVTEGDHQALASALVSLVHGQADWSPGQARWAEYSDLHSAGQLRAAFRSLLSGGE